MRYAKKTGALEILFEFKTMASSFSNIPQSALPLPLHPTLPTMYDLPSENQQDESGFPDYFNFLQATFLYYTFQPSNWNPNLVYNAVSMYLYYDVNNTLLYKRPDWFGVVGVERLYQGHDLRLSYLTWQEKANPSIVIEFLFPGTEEENLSTTEHAESKPPTKWDVYEKILKVPYYVVFNRFTDEMKPFHLVDGRYETMDFSSNGRLDMPELSLSLGLWEGEFERVDRLWLRWFTLEGKLIQTSEEEVAEAKQKTAEAEQEIAEAKQKTAEAEREIAEAKQEIAEAKQKTAEAKQKTAEAERKAAEEKIRVEKFERMLRQLGINPDDIK